MLNNLQRWGTEHDIRLACRSWPWLQGLPPSASSTTYIQKNGVKLLVKLQTVRLRGLCPQTTVFGVLSPFLFSGPPGAMLLDFAGDLHPQAL